MSDRRTLDPKLDVVFKMLFAAEKNQRLLISLLNAVLQPEQPIVRVTVVNPEVTRESVSQHGAILDVRGWLQDGRQVDIEMQASPRPSLRERFVYYWARSFGDQLQRGDEHASLMPVIGIFILDFRQLPGDRLHSTYQLLEAERHDLLTDVLELHFLELPKLPLEARRRGRASRAAKALLNWCSFLAAKSDEELETLAMTDPEMQAAKTALDELSADPAARRLAEERRLAEWNDKYTRAREREAGREEGREEGRAAGQVELLLKLLRIRFGDIPAEVEAQVRAAPLDALERYAQRVLSASRLGDVVEEQG